MPPQNFLLCGIIVYACKQRAKTFPHTVIKRCFQALIAGAKVPPHAARGVPPTMSRRGVKAPTGLNKAVSRPRLARSATYQKRVNSPHSERNEQGRRNRHRKKRMTIFIACTALQCGREPRWLCIAFEGVDRTGEAMQRSAILSRFFPTGKTGRAFRAPKNRCFPL